MFALDVAEEKVETKEKRKIKKNEQKLISFDFLLVVPKILFLILVFLLPILFLSHSVSSLAATKLSFVFLFIFVSLICICISNFGKKKITVPWGLFGISVLLIPLVYIISGIFSSNVVISFVGRDFGLDTVVAMLIYFVLLAIAAFVTKAKKQNILYIYLALFAASLILAIIHLLNVLIPGFPASGFFDSSTITTVGKWNDLGLFALLLVILSVVTLEQIKLVKQVKIFIYIVFILNLILILLVNFNFCWFLLLGFAVFFFLYRWFTTKKISKLTIGVAALSLVFIFAGQFIGNAVYSALNISHIEARPSLSATADIIKGTLSESPMTAIFGVGPAMFEVEWPKYRPESVLFTEFWNNDFRYGHGLLPSFIVTTGILGGVTWLLFFIFFIIASIRGLLRKKLSKDEQYLFFSSFISTLFLWVVAIFYLPSATLLVLTFIFTGIYLAVLYKFGLFRTKEFSVVGKKSITFTVVQSMLILVILFIGFIMAKKFVAQVYFKQSVTEINQAGDLDIVETKILKANELDPIDTYFRSLAEINIIRLGNLFDSISQGLEVSEQEVGALVGTIISQHDQAVFYDPNNYNNFMSFANFYRVLAGIGTQGVADTAKLFYERTLALKPNNPFTYLQLARIEAINGNDLLAKNMAEKALELKPNYTDAAFFLAQLEINLDQAEEALAVLQNTAVNSPGDALLHFQLGVLAYNLSQFDLAVAALEQAIRLNNNFQNAIYFLGLSYFEVDRLEESIFLFEQLQLVNPDNEELPFILNNLRAGNTPYLNSESPIVEPEDKEELPLEDGEADESGDTVSDLDSAE